MNNSCETMSGCKSTVTGSIQSSGDRKRSTVFWSSVDLKAILLMGNVDRLPLEWTTVSSLRAELEGWWLDPLWTASSRGFGVNHGVTVHVRVFSQLWTPSMKAKASFSAAAPSRSFISSHVVWAREWRASRVSSRPNFMLKASTNRQYKLSWGFWRNAGGCTIFPVSVVGRRVSSSVVPTFNTPKIYRAKRRLLYRLKQQTYSERKL